MLELEFVFDAEFYLGRNPDVAAAVEAGVIASAFDHFVQFGLAEGRVPSSLVEQMFDSAFYLANNPDVAAAVDAGVFANAMQHFLLNGQIEGRDPSVFFQTQTYLANNPDVAAAVAAGAVPSAFSHFVANGAAEGRAAGNAVASATGDVLLDGTPVTDLPATGGSLQVGNMAEGSANLGNGAGLVLTSDNFDGVFVGNGNVGTLVVSDGTLETIAIDPTIRVGNQGGDGTLIVQDGAVINTLQLDVGRDGTGLAILRGEGTHFIASNDVGRFSDPFFNFAGFVRVGREDGSDGRLEVLDGATLTIRPGEGINENTSGAGLSLARNSTSTGEFLIDNGTLEIMQATVGEFGGPFIEVGGSGTADFTARNGAQVSITGESANVTVGLNEGSVGTMTVTGEGTVFQHMGQFGGVFAGGFSGSQTSGSLTVSDGAFLTTNRLEGRGTDSEITITGEGTLVNVTSANGVPFGGEFIDEGGFFRISQNDGDNGSLSILDGAQVLVDSADDQSGPFLQFARNPGSTADILIDGEGTRLDVVQTAPLVESLGGPFMQAGRSGAATTTIQNGAVLSFTGPAAGFQISRGDTGGPVLDPSSLNVLSGGKVLVNGIDSPDQGFFTFASAGQRANGDGNILVSGAGSEIVIESSVTSNIIIGGEGDGDLMVSEGGRVASLFMNVGDDSSGTGSVTITGSGSVLELSGVAGDGSNDAGFGAFLTVGRSGAGELQVLNGGSIAISSVEGEFPGINVGQSESGSGTITVDGAGSNITITGENTAIGGGSGFMAIGRAGDGALNISNGGQVINDGDLNTASFVGRLPTGDGIVSVTGNGSLWDAGEILVIGANLDFDTGEVLFDAGGTGVVTVGSGGTIQAGVAEGDGVGDIFIGTGGTLEVLVGGILIGDVVNEGGTFIPGNSPGVVGVSGDLTHADGDLEFEFAGTGVGQFDRIEVGGQASLDGELELLFIDGYAGQAGDSFEILTAGDGLSVGDGLEFTVAGLADGLEVDLSVGDDSLLASISAVDLVA